MAKVESGRDLGRASIRGAIGRRQATAGDFLDKSAGKGMKLAGAALDDISEKIERQQETKRDVKATKLIGKLDREHPLRRAKDAIGVVSRIRRELVSNRLMGQDGKVTPMPANKRREVSGILSRLSMLEARNGLIAIGDRGWKQKLPLSRNDVLAELKASSENVFAEYQRHLTKAKVYDADIVHRQWPEVSKRLSVGGADSDLSDLVLEAKYAD